MLHAWEKFGYLDAEKEYQRKYCHKKPNNPYKKDLPRFQKVLKGKIEFLGMVRGHQDKIYIRLNNKAADLERASGLPLNLFSFLEDPEGEIISLIAQGETEEVEFKEGACLNPHTRKDNKKDMTQKSYVKSPLL
jgi:RNA-directed DNA polymerase